MSTTHQTPFSLLLSRARFATGLTQQQAATILKVGLSSFQKWETGDRTPKPLMQEALLAKLATMPQISR